MSGSESDRKGPGAPAAGEDAPRVSASAADSRAEELLGLAASLGVPVDSDPELAAVLSTLDADAAIPDDAYPLLAEVLGFAWAVRQQVVSGPDAAPGPAAGDRDPGTPDSADD